MSEHVIEFVPVQRADHGIGFRRARGFDRVQPLQRGGVVGRLRGIRPKPVMRSGEAVGPGAGRGIQIPVPRHSGHNPRIAVLDPVDVGKIQQRRRDGGFQLGFVEESNADIALCCVIEHRDHIGIGAADVAKRVRKIGLGVLLGYDDGFNDLAAMRDNDRRHQPRAGFAEAGVLGDRGPALVLGLCHQVVRGRGRDRRQVERVVVEVLAASGPGEGRARRNGGDCELFSLGGHLGDLGCDRRVLYVHQEVGAGIIGLPGERRCLRRLVVIVERIDHDGPAQYGAAEIGNRHAGCVHSATARSRVVQIIVQIRDHGYADRRRLRRMSNAGECRTRQQASHPSRDHAKSFRSR